MGFLKEHGITVSGLCVLSMAIPMLEFVVVPFLFSRLNETLRDRSSSMSFVRGIVLAVLGIQIAHILRGACIVQLVSTFDVFVKTHLMDHILMHARQAVCPLQFGLPSQLELSKSNLRRYRLPPIGGIRHGQHMDGVAERSCGAICVRRFVCRRCVRRIGFRSACITFGVSVLFVVVGATIHERCSVACNPTHGDHDAFASPHRRHNSKFGCHPYIQFSHLDDPCGGSFFCESEQAMLKREFANGFVHYKQLVSHSRCRPGLRVHPVWLHRTISHRWFWSPAFCMWY